MPPDIATPDAALVSARAEFDRLWSRGTTFLGCRVAIMGGLVIGTPLGGLLAGTFGITAPFWFGFIGSAALVAVLWRQLEHIAHAHAS